MKRFDQRTGADSPGFPTGPKADDSSFQVFGQQARSRLQTQRPASHWLPASTAGVFDAACLHMQPPCLQFMWFVRALVSLPNSYIAFMVAIG